MVRVEVADGDVELALDALWQLGPTAITETPTPAGAVLLAGYRSPGDAAAAAEALTRLGIVAATEAAAQDPAWIDAWRADEPPHRVADVVVHLPEHDPPPGLTTVEIEPGAAFGFGHASTRLALGLLAAIDLTAASVLDVGCGTGVLAVAAARLGAADVTAVDVDPTAVEITRDNAARNEVRIRTLHGSVEQVAARRFDVVVANLSAATIAELAPALAALLAPSGQLILSGMLDEGAARTGERFPELSVVETAAEGGWLALRLRA